ncbi:MAG: ribulose-phosphate 3-epimerase [Clostridiales bacterium]|nr:ribulose-phosphate 3-epimerase [Clostridiales bacterium]
MQTIIAPSLLAADAGCWRDEIILAAGEGIRHLHLDIMDGHFVPNLTFGPAQVGMLRAYSAMEFDAHLMVSAPETLIPAFAKAGVDSLTVHQEACPHLHRILDMIREQGMKPGVALNPSTPVELLAPMLPFLDRVLVMTVNPGYGGQKAILEMLKKVEWLKNEKYRTKLEYQIQVDGGIDQQNVRQFLSAGAENLVIGSALYQSGMTSKNIRAFQDLLSAYEATIRPM